VRTGLPQVRPEEVDQQDPRLDVAAALGSVDLHAYLARERVQVLLF
jgi:hypothetical protein